MTPEILKLYPLPDQEIAGALYENLEIPPIGRRDPSRPYVVINMVSSIDGKTTIGGKSSRIGSATDRQAMRTLRFKADAVMIGANTLRAERLSLDIDEPMRDLQPLAVIVTNSGDVPLESNLIVGEGQKVVVIGPESLDYRVGRRARVLQVPTTPAGEVDLGEALAILRSEYAVQMLLVEGGPTLNHSLVSANLVDELFLTLSPKLIGGMCSNTTLTILEGGDLPLPQTPKLRLVSVHLSKDELFLRYRWQS